MTLITSRNCVKISLIALLVILPIISAPFAQSPQKTEIPPPTAGATWGFLEEFKASQYYLSPETSPGLNDEVFFTFKMDKDGNYTISVVNAPAYFASAAANEAEISFDQPSGTDSWYFAYTELRDIFSGQFSLKLRTSHDFGKTWAVNSIAGWQATGDNFFEIMYYLHKSAIAIRPTTGVCAAFTWVNNSDLTFISSLDNGSTWSTPRKIMDKADVGYTGFSIVMPNIDTGILPNGSIVVVCDANTTAMPQLTPIVYLESHNNGVNWSESPQNVTCIKTPEASKARIQVDATGGNYWLMWRAKNGTVTNNRWAEFSEEMSLGTDVTAKVAETLTGNFDFIRDRDGHFRMFDIKRVYPKPVNNTQWFCNDFASSWTKNQILPRIEELDNQYSILNDFCLAFDGKTEYYFYSDARSEGEGTSLFQYTYVNNRTFWEKKGNFTAGNLAQVIWNGKAEAIYPINSSRVQVKFVGQNSSYTPTQINSSLYINLDNLDPNFNHYTQKKSFFNPLSQNITFHNLDWMLESSESVTYKLEIFQNQTSLSPWRFITEDNFDQAINTLEILLSATGQLYVIYRTIKEGVEELCLIRSSNGGVSWTTPTTVLTTSGSIEAITAATYADNVVVVIANYSMGSGFSTESKLFRSFDQGDSFEPPIPLIPPLFPTAFHGIESCAFSRNGTLFTGFIIPVDDFYRPYLLGEFHVLRSDNFGLTWSESQMWYLNPAYNATQVQPVFVADPYNDLIHVCFAQNNNTGNSIVPDQYKVGNFTFSTFNMSTQLWGPLTSTGDFSIDPYSSQPQFILWRDDPTSPVAAKVMFLRYVNFTSGLGIIYDEIESKDFGKSWSLLQNSSLNNATMVAVEAGTVYYVGTKSDGNDEEVVLSRESRKVRTQEGSLPPAQESYLIFNGKGDDDSYLPAGNYSFRLILVDNAGNRENQSGWFYIDYTDPSITEGPSSNWSVLATPRFDVNISVQVTDDIGFGVWLHYQKDAEVWQTLSMTTNGGGSSPTYSAIIPGDESTKSVKYYVTATDIAGNEAVQDNDGARYEFHVPGFEWTATGLFNSSIKYSSNQEYNFNVIITKDFQFVNQVIFRYSFDGTNWTDQILVASGNVYSGAMQNLPGDLKNLLYQLIIVDVFNNEVVLLSIQQAFFHPELPRMIFSDSETILVLIASLMIGIAVALGYMKLKTASHRVVSRQITYREESSQDLINKRTEEQDEKIRKSSKMKQQSNEILIQKSRSPFTYVFMGVFAALLLVLLIGMQFISLSPEWAIIILAGSLLLGIFGFMILSSRDIAENLYFEKIRYSNVLLEIMQVGILLVIILNILQVGYMIPWFRYYLIDSTYNLFGLLIPKLFVSVIGVFFTSLVIVLISTYLELRKTVRNIQLQKKEGGLSGIALQYIKDEHSNRLITNVGIKTVVFLITVLVAIISTTDLLNYENIIALAMITGPFTLACLFVLMIQPAVNKRREKTKTITQIPFVEAEKVCGKCSTKNFLSSRFCRICGTQLVFEPVVGQYNTRCGHCGGLITKESTFCTICGTKTIL